MNACRGTASTPLALDAALRRSKFIRWQLHCAR